MLKIMLFWRHTTTSKWHCFSQLGWNHYGGHFLHIS